MTNKDMIRIYIFKIQYLAEAIKVYCLVNESIIRKHFIIQGAKVKILTFHKKIH